ncbi:MAG: DUF1127 domain-containing protein [Rhodobacteraceae bacterium]|nr:DUF1127 domain-containing protein [Paracoccaceae bacterium]
MNTQTAIGSSLVSVLADLIKRAKQRRNYLKTVSELNSLSMRELDDLGLTRGSIDEIAHKSVYGR